MHVAVVPRSGATAAVPVDVPAPGLPGEHFAAAMIFFVLGTVGLAYVASDLANGFFFLPQVIAVVHLFTLGWIVTSIFGALCQFLPVAVGRGLRWPRAAHVSFAAHVVGVSCFVAGVATGRPALAHAGACGLAIGFVLFAVNLAATLAAVRERGLTWWALAGAAVFLIVTPAYGVVLALNLGGGELIGASRFTVVAEHAHVAIVGIILLVIVGVAHRLLPMFLLSHGASERPAWAAITMLFAGATLLAIPIGGDVRIPVAGALASAGVVAFLVQAVTFFRHRRKRALDPGMRLAATGLVGLAVAVLVAPFALSRGLSAADHRAGKFEIADGGTLFLDEIGELPMSIQPKLLRALQSGEVQRVGSDRMLKADVRVIAATNRDLAEEVRAGRFRPDLFHRLSVYPLHVPPLRERRDDIALLSGYFMDTARARLGLGPLRLTPEARARLHDHDWPGNVRELEHTLLRAALRASLGRRHETIVIDVAHLGLDTPPAPHAAPAGAPVGPLRDAVDDFTRRLITRAVEQADGNWAEAARHLGLQRSNLHRLATRLGLTPHR